MGRLSCVLWVALNIITSILIFLKKKAEGDLAAAEVNVTTEARCYSAGPEEECSLEARKGKKTDSHLEPPERAQPCRHLDISSTRLLSQLWPPER